MNVKLALALFKLVTAIIGVIERQHWYQEGRDAANAEANAEQQKRIAEALAARADADALSADPLELREDDGHRRPRQVP